MSTTHLDPDDRPSDYEGDDPHPVRTTGDDEVRYADEWSDEP